MKNYQKPICAQIEVETEQNLLLISKESITVGLSGGIVIGPNGSTRAATWND